MDTTSEFVSQWGIVELMGHKVVAGSISKSELFGKPMLRVDIPSIDGIPAFTQLYGEASIYCVTFTTEEIAYQAAKECHIKPIFVYEVRQLQEPNNRDDDDESMGDDDD
jgi:hypothetical protein